MDIKNTVANFAKEHMDEVYKLLYDICHIPAPSHYEHKRAEYCKKWFDEQGFDGTYIDNALNVIVPYQAEGKNDLTVFVAHTDTVFPDTEPMPYIDDGEYIRCPGVGDDTASLAILMVMAKFFKENKIEVPGGVLFVANSCEEGLGNLKGTRQLFKDFEGRIKQFFSFDCFALNLASDVCVGSHRYEVEVLTEGGHSWGKFGNANAIAELSKIITEIYSITLPEKEGKKVSYNVGEISGGTSVNTIAQSAKMLCEYRSDDEELLAFMKKKFNEIFALANTDKVTVNVKTIGERPCASLDLDFDKIEAFKKILDPIVAEIAEQEVSYKKSSTDCNIPLSLGIPALTIGVYDGGGAHTREEWLKKSSLLPGLEIAIRSALEFTK